MRIPPPIALIAALATAGGCAQGHTTSTVFDHSGIQPGAITESCHRMPECSAAKVLAFEVLEQNPAESRIALTLLGGTRKENSQTTHWAEQPHTVVIHCSLSRPATELPGTQPPRLIPFGSETGVPYVLMSDANLYLKACHNFDGNNDLQDITEKLGYRVQESDYQAFEESAKPHFEQTKFIRGMYAIRQGETELNPVRYSAGILQLEARRDEANSRSGNLHCDVFRQAIPGNGGIAPDFFSQPVQVLRLANGRIRASFTNMGDRQAVEFSVSCTRDNGCQIDDEYVNGQSYATALQQCQANP